MQARREGSGGTREYIRILMLLRDHPLPAVTLAVEQAANLGVYSYAGVKGFLGGVPQICRHHPAPQVWPHRVDHFDRLVQG